MTCATNLYVARVALYKKEERRVGHCNFHILTEHIFESRASKEEEKDSVAEEEEFLKNIVSEKEEARGLEEDLAEVEVTCDLQLLILIRVSLNLS